MGFGRDFLERGGRQVGYGQALPAIDTAIQFLNLEIIVRWAKEYSAEGFLGQVAEVAIRYQHAHGGCSLGMLVFRSRRG